MTYSTTTRFFATTTRALAPTSLLALMLGTGCVASPETQEDVASTESASTDSASTDDALAGECPPGEKWVCTIDPRTHIKECDCVAVSPPNLVRDSSFEEQHDRYAIQLPWLTEGSNGRGIDIGLGYAPAGLNNAYMRTNTGWTAFRQNVQVQPHTNYHLSTLINTSANVADAYFGVRHGETWNVLSETKLGPVLGWSTRAVDFNSGNDSEVTVFLGYWAPNADSWVQFDAVQLRATP